MKTRRFCINIQRLHGNFISRSSALHRDLTVENIRTAEKKSSKNAMKVFALVFLSAILAYASASVLPEVLYDGPIEGEDGKIITLEDVDTDGGLTTSTELSPIRHRRVTCDLLSIQTPWLGFNHAACAARCLFQKRKGGTCRDGICHCRG